mgnify:FL=1
MAKAQILIVEDDHDLREALVTTLELSKFRVREAASAQEALARLAEAPVDMVVSDVNMPGLSGHELLAEVQRLYPGLPMMLITAYGQIKSAVDGIVSFPEQAERPIVKRLEFQKHTVNVELYGDLDERSLKSLGEQVKQEMLQDPDMGHRVYRNVTHILAERLRDNNILLEQQYLVLDDLVDLVDLPHFGVGIGTDEF